MQGNYLFITWNTALSLYERNETNHIKFASPPWTQKANGGRVNVVVNHRETQ